MQNVSFLFFSLLLLGTVGCVNSSFYRDAPPTAPVGAVAPIVVGITPPTSAALPETTPDTVSLGSKLFAIWGSHGIRAAVYDCTNDSSPNWKRIGGGPHGYMNKDQSKQAYNPRLAVFNSKIYSIWDEGDNSPTHSQIRVAVYNGNESAPQWNFIDGNGTAGINHDPTKDAYHPKLIVFNSKLYATWQEYNSQAYSNSQIKVAVYNGNDLAPQWTYVDGLNGLNYDPLQGAHYVQMTVLNSSLYATWREANANTAQIRAAVYNGDDSNPLWTMIDGNGSEGLNKDPLVFATNPEIVGFNGKLYVSWQEDQVRVAVYDPAFLSWNFVEGNSPSSASPMAFKVFEGALYSTWQEGRPSFAAKAYFARYGGDDSEPVWNRIDGTTGDGVNQSQDTYADRPQMAVCNSKLYLTWGEGPPSDFHVYQSVAITAN